MIQDPFQLLVALFGIVFFSVILEKKFSFARKLSPVVLILIIAALFSNLGLISNNSSFYNNVTDFTVPFAVCLVLFQVKIADFKKVGLPMFVAFIIGTLGTFTGVILGGLLLNPFLQNLLGPDSWKLAGPFTGTYIGGSLNFFALWTGLEIGKPDLFAAANAVDNAFLLPTFLFMLIVPEKLVRFYPVAKTWKGSESGSAEQYDASKIPKFRILDLVALSFMSMMVMYVSRLIKTEFITSLMPQFPTILIITTFALILAQLKFITKLEGANELSNISFYIFFASVGAMMNIKSAVVLTPILFIFVIIITITHWVFVFGFGRLARLDVRLLAIASMAVKSGPSTVLALVNVKGWIKLALPGVVAGLLGYALGNYIGFGTAYLMKYLLGM